MSFLYTTARPEDIFPAELTKTELVNIAGGFLEGVKSESGMQITRLISTDPKLYLDVKYSPGASFKKNNFF
ncbi:MAG: YlzJ-like family protein [Hydrogenoanaerobacterium sp.]